MNRQITSHRVTIKLELHSLNADEARTLGRLFESRTPHAHADWTYHAPEWLPWTSEPSWDVTFTFGTRAAYDNFTQGMPEGIWDD
jgi:hypothetical protein